jgi:limonene-1,2-epoxide hydrolase
MQDLTHGRSTGPHEGHIELSVRALDRLASKTIERVATAYKERVISAPVDVEDWSERYRRAWEEADDDAVVALFTEDATYRSNPFEEPHRGHEGIRTYWRNVTRSQSNVSVEIGRTMTDGRRAVVEWWTQMDNDELPVTLPGALILDFAEDGRCSALREYWNLEVGRRLPPPEGWGT